MGRMTLAGSKEGINSPIEDLEESLESAELQINILSEPWDAKATVIEAIETFRQYILAWYPIGYDCSLDFSIINK